MIDEIEDYEPRSTTVVAVDEGRLEIFADGGVPDDGEAVLLEADDGRQVHAVVRRHLGGRRIATFAPALPAWVEEGTPASPTGRPGGFRLRDGRLVVAAENLEPEPDSDDPDWIPVDWTSPEFTALAANLPPIETGWESVDTLAPLTRGGLNLAIDRTDRPHSFRHLVERVHRDLEQAETIWLLDSPSDEAPDWAEIVVEPAAGPRSGMFALRTTVALAADRRDRGRETLVVASLPGVGRTVASEDDISTTPGYGELVDRIGSGLASTDQTHITTLLRLPIPTHQADLAPVVETLDLGDVETQLFIDEDARFSPRRSASDATLDDAHRERRAGARKTLRRADEARERAELLGERELTDEQRRALEREDELRESLA